MAGFWRKFRGLALGLGGAALLPLLTPLHGAPVPRHPLAQALWVERSLTMLERHYFDPERIDPNGLFEAALQEIQKVTPEILARCEPKKFCAVTVKQAVKRFAYPGRDLTRLKQIFKELFPYLARHVDPDTEQDLIEHAAIQGMLNALDPHSAFLTPDAYREFRVGTEGEFGGLGIVISIKDGRLEVTTPLADTPAWRAGIRAGDHILQIDDESTINMSLTEAVGRLRGPVGTRVTVHLERTGRKEPLVITLTRAIINIQSVQSKVVKSPSGQPIGFIRVKNFQATTRRDVQKHLNRLVQKTGDLKGVVLDLRNNPGGLLDQSVHLADLFLTEGTIVSTVGRKGKLLDYKKARDDQIEGGWPLVVLVNEGSASASEIVAGALKNNQRALVIGHTTFGKGTVQSIFELPLEAAIKITVGQYLTPGNRSIQSIGITPDILLSEVIVSREHLDAVENIQTLEKDLEKHLAAAGPSEQPLFQLRYLAPPPDQEEENAYPTEIDLSKDIAAQLSLKIIESPEPKRMSLLQAEQEKESQKIAQAFQALGIDWSHSESAAQGKLQVELTRRLLQGGKEIKRASAGSEVDLEIQLKNAGSTPLDQLVAQTDAPAYYFKNMEFAFGKVAPGQSRSWTHRLKIPKAHLTEEVHLTLHFREAHGHPPPQVEVILPITGLPPPRFAHRFSLEKNAIDKLKAGKTVQLNVEVQNVGRGPSEQTVAAIKNLGGKEVFIEKGRAALESLQPGSSQNAPFRFHLDPAIQNGPVRFKLSIFDNELLVSSEQTLTLNPASGHFHPADGKWYRPPEITLQTAAAAVPKSPWPLQGKVQDDQIIRDLFIFVDENKTYYSANAEGSGQFSFQALLPLKEGNNTVVITARDNDNLVSRHLQVIRLQ